MRIAILDDDATQIDLIAGVLEQAGYRTAAFGRAAALTAELGRETYDLLIVDWHLPDSPGIDLIRWVRSTIEPPPPVLLVTSRTDDQDIVEGLEAGADDYLSKPISPMVLIARVVALLRRAYPRPVDGAVETYAGYTFAPTLNQVTFRGEEVTLTAKEFSLALVLFRNLSRALSRTYLNEAVWGRDAGLNSRSLDMHVSRVRTKLQLRSANGLRLAPVYSYGYRLERVLAT